MASQPMVRSRHKRNGYLISFSSLQRVLCCGPSRHSASTCLEWALGGSRHEPKNLRIDRPSKVSDETFFGGLTGPGESHAADISPVDTSRHSGAFLVVDSILYPIDNRSTTDDTSRLKPGRTGMTTKRSRTDKAQDGHKA
jgi:hypothetical protein